jgi:hypothetical protein
MFRVMAKKESFGNFPNLPVLNEDNRFGDMANTNDCLTRKTILKTPCRRHRGGTCLVMDMAGSTP